MNSIISPGNTWALWAVLAGVAAGAITLEQKYKWASRITGCVLALIGTMALANLKIIPTQSPVYDSVWNYVVPLAIPLLLFQCNIRKIGKESGRLLLIYLISSLGTLLGAFAGFFLLARFVPELATVAAMFSATYVGGSVNFAAMAGSFHASEALSSSAVVADNLLMALYFFVLMAIPALPFFRKRYPHPLVDAAEAGGGGSVSGYWKRREISLRDIAFDFAAAVIIVAVSTMTAELLAKAIPASNWLFSIFSSLLGNKYLIMTTVTMACATLAPRTFGDAPGANEIGTFLIYIFFAVIGAPASIYQIVTKSPLLLVYALIIVAVNMLVSLAAGRLLHFNLEEIILASNANIGGPTTAAAMAISRGWGPLVGPVMLIGTLGYVLGNYYGILVGSLLLPK